MNPAGAVRYLPTMLNQSACVAAGGVWANSPTTSDFDDLGSALIYLFEARCEGS
jgi:hypothetical protein